MNASHIAVEDMALLAGLPPESPEHRHIASCTQCRARWLDYQSFMAAHELPQEARAAEARAAIDEWLSREVEGIPTEVRRPASAPDSFRPVALKWAAAACSVLGIAALTTWYAGPRRPTSVLRGIDPHERGRLSLVAAKVGADGVARLTWHSQPGADRYEVRIYGPDLALITRLDAGADSSVTVPGNSLGHAPRPGSEVSWQVVASARGAEISSSDLGKLLVP